MTAIQIALQILDDPDRARCGRRIRTLLERRQKPHSDPIAAAVLDAPVSHEREAEWFAAIHHVALGAIVGRCRWNIDAGGHFRRTDLPVPHGQEVPHPSVLGGSDNADVVDLGKSIARNPEEAPEIVAMIRQAREQMNGARLPFPCLPKTWNGLTANDSAEPKTPDATKGPRHDDCQDCPPPTPAGDGSHRL